MIPVDESFIAFADATTSRLLRMAWLTCGDHQLAEDLVRGALVAVYQRWAVSARATRQRMPGAASSMRT